MAASHHDHPDRRLPSMHEVWEWQEQLVRFGTRLTGSHGHATCVEWLADQLGAVPGLTVRTDRLTFNRWLARHYALRVRVPASIGASGPVPLTYYYPYSGQTPPHGVTAKLVDLGTYTPAAPGSAGSGYTPAFWAPAKGAIALVRTPPPVFALNAGQAATGGYEPGKSSAQAAADYTAYAAARPHPAWQGIFAPVPLQDARTAGVLGVICATPLALTCPGWPPAARPPRPWCSVEAAPAISTDPRIRLPSASPHRCDGKETKVFHLRSGQQRLVAHHQKFSILGHLTPGQHHQTAEEAAREQVDDEEDHSAMMPTRPVAQARSSNPARPDPVIEPHRPL